MIEINLLNSMSGFSGKDCSISHFMPDGVGVSSSLHAIMEIRGVGAIYKCFFPECNLHFFLPKTENRQ